MHLSREDRSRYLPSHRSRYRTILPLGEANTAKSGRGGHTILHKTTECGTCERLCVGSCSSEGYSGSLAVPRCRRSQARHSPMRCWCCQSLYTCWGSIHRASTHVCGSGKCASPLVPIACAWPMLGAVCSMPVSRQILFGWTHKRGTHISSRPKREVSSGGRRSQRRA